MVHPELIAHWPLAKDADDALGHFHGKARGLSFGAGPGKKLGGAAAFNGRDSAIEVADAPALRLHNLDFTLAAWVRCTTPMRGLYGDLFSKFDADQRCGVNLWVAGSAPGYNGMSDARHVHFGIDDGYLGPWEDCGRPWPSNPLVPCLVSYQGQLYGGLSDADRPEDAGHVFRWAGGQKWVDCGRLGNDPTHLSAMSMLVHGGKLYAGTGIWDWGRATEAAKHDPPYALTRVFVYEGGTTWRDLGQVGRAARVLCMASFEGELYVGLDRGGGGGCFKLVGEKWVSCGGFDPSDNFECLMQFGGVLYGASHFAVYRYEGGTKWTCLGRKPHDISQIHSMTEFDGKLVIGTWPQGYVLRYAGGEQWEIMGRLGLPEGKGVELINEINALQIHNGKLYAGVLPKAQIHRYERDGLWTLLGSFASRADFDQAVLPTWGRVVSLTTHAGRLFAATGACQARAIDLDPERTMGRVLAAQAGQVVDHERDIGGAWTHIAAIRRGKRLALYVDGELSAESEAPAGQAFDLANVRPLLIGRGPQGSFDGSIADVRLYRGALGAAEIAGLQLSC
ncbi:MAG: LamG domain-containing protein [Planctomycetota bacterium]|nr:LamG domain-containing protein [Planctomycetota bacterium]